MEMRIEALALLRLQIEWGADEALVDEPVDRFRALAPARAAVAVAVAAEPPGPVRVVRPAPVAEVPRGTAAERAVAAAAAADTLAALRAAVVAFDGCALRDTASNTVFAEGDPAARVLLIGEPPGAEEDRSGQPFAGADGVLLDKMLASVGLDRSGLLLAPLIPWRPPGGRPPNPGEMAACLPFLHRLLVLAAPAHVVLFGTLTMRTLLPARKRGAGWTDLAGDWGRVPALALPGLAAMRTTPLLRRDAWAGLRLLRRALDC
jgi:DNA polymerase